MKVTTEKTASVNDDAARPVIDVKNPLDSIVDESETLIAQQPNIFHRGGELIQVVREEGAKVRVRALSIHSTCYMLSRAATWTDEGKPVHPPTRVARCLVDKTSWPNVRPLRAVTNFPPMASTGVLATTPGYDATTSVYFTGDVACDVPEHPTLDNAKTAVAMLLDIVCDFPLAGDGHRSAFLAALLSPLARFAHTGHTPLVIIQANGPRVGKTTLAMLISHIVMGYECAVITHTKNEDETRKRLLSFLRVARTMVLVDNVVGQYGGANVNALATAAAFEDRVLGQSKVIDVANDTTWFVTGNNIALAPDTAERCLHIRLRSDDARPHLRTGFRYPDIFATVRERRAQLLSAALTILRAYIAAGMPVQGLPAWGSFEPWSRLVRGALVWSGMPDPASTRDELEWDADVKRHSGAALVEGWLELQLAAGATEGLTTAEACTLLRGSNVSAPALRSVLEEIARAPGEIPTPHTLGRHLREVRDRTFGGNALRCVPNDKTGHLWFVEVVAAAEQAPRGTGDRGTAPAIASGGPKGDDSGRSLGRNDLRTGAPRTQ